MRKFLTKIIQSLKYTGILRTLQRGIQRTFPAWVFDVNDVVGVETSLSAILADWEGLPHNDALHHRWATEVDTDHLTRGGHSLDEVRAFFSQGGRAAISTMDGKPVGYFWLFPQAKNYLGWLRLEAGPGEILGWHIYVAPEYRGERWFREVRRFVFPQLVSEGYERMLGFISSLNRSSLRSAASAERRNVGRIFYVRMLSLTLYRIGRKWGLGLWTEKHPYPFSFDALRARPA